MKLVAYVRVSTDRQAEEGLGLTVQEQHCKRWARANGHRIEAIHRDEGISGSNGVEDRLGLPLVLVDLKDRRADGLVVARLDRLARALTVQEAILGKVWSFGAGVFTVDGGEVMRDDPDDPMRTAMRQMVGVFSQLERAMIAKRMRDGRRAKAEAGGYAYGAPPLGKATRDGQLVDDPDEKQTVDRIAALHAEGRSFRQIAAVLDEEGYRSKRGGRWHPETLRRVVARSDRPQSDIGSTGSGH